MNNRYARDFDRRRDERPRYEDGRFETESDRDISGPQRSRYEAQNSYNSPLGDTQYGDTREPVRFDRRYDDADFEGRLYYQDRYARQGAPREANSASGIILGAGASWNGPNVGQPNSFAGRGPKGYRRSDERILEEVNEALTERPEIDPSEIEVKVSNGEVTLSGTVAERQFKRIAEDIAEKCSGVVDVKNEIRVELESHSNRETGKGKPILSMGGRPPESKSA